MYCSLNDSGFYWCHGPLVNINNIAGSYAGIVFGITNTFGTLPGVIGPYIVGVITKNVTMTTTSSCRVVFLLLESFCIVVLSGSKHKANGRSSSSSARPFTLSAQWSSSSSRRAICSRGPMCRRCHSTQLQQQKRKIRHTRRTCTNACSNTNRIMPSLFQSCNYLL